MVSYLMQYGRYSLSSWVNLGVGGYCLYIGWAGLTGFHASPLLLNWADADQAAHYFYDFFYIYSLKISFATAVFTA